MTEAEAVKAIWFGPLAYGFYLLGIFVAMVTYYEWKWARICKNYIQVLVVQQGGGGSFELAPKTGGQVTIKNPHNNTIRTWAVNELTTIDILYPGVGFIPAFLQKTIRLAIVHEGDWEPLLNRSPHLRNVASPDMVTALEAISKDANQSIKLKIDALLKDVRTAPTRAMIADPSVLGGLMQSSVLQALAQVSKEVTDVLKGVASKLNKLINPWVVYVGLGLTVILICFMLLQVIPAMDKITEMANDISLIKQGLGMSGVNVPPAP